MAVNDVIETAMVYDVTGGAGEFVNVLHFRQSAYDGVSSRPTLGGILAGLLSAAALLNYVPALSVAITLDRIDWFFVNDPVIGSSLPIGVAGPQAGDLISLRSAPVAKKITGLRGRRFRGRVFLMPIRELSQSFGQIDPTEITTLQTWLDSIITLDDGAGNTFSCTVYSRAGSTPPTLILDNPIQSWQINTVLGSVRGRQTVT